MPEFVRDAFGMVETSVSSSQSVSGSVMGHHKKLFKRHTIHLILLRRHELVGLASSNTHARLRLLQCKLTLMAASPHGVPLMDTEVAASSAESGSAPYSSSNAPSPNLLPVNAPPSAVGPASPHSSSISVDRPSSVVILQGDAGIGKSHTLVNFLRNVDQEKVRMAGNSGESLCIHMCVTCD